VTPIYRRPCEKMRRKILELAPRELSLLDVRRRVGGCGHDRAWLMFTGKRISVSPDFGCNLQNLIFAGAIRLDRVRGKIRVRPGRNWRRCVDGVSIDQLD
jgi:hypothetical protein